MKMRSAIFLTLSLVVHAVCITALALSHFKSLESPDGSEVEVTMGDNTQEPGKLIASNEVQPESPPVVKPIEKVAVPKPLPKKEVVKEKKIVKAKIVKPATTLPAKEKPAVESEPESMNPKIEDSDAVAIATPVVEEEAPKFIPVKEKVSAHADEAEDKTEASSKDMNVEDPTPVPEQKPAPAAPASGKADDAKKEESKVVAALGHGGETKAAAVDFKELRQFSGNQPPIYPMTARKDQRQGEVDLLYRVTKEGRVSEVQIHKSSGHSDLDEAAVKAIAKYKFIPGQEGWAKQPVIFTLKGVATSLPSKLRSNSAATE